ncbi:MAG: glutamate--tRNA ligase [Candidatus Omnitrophica bacterium]|nr:glutamate--tRNA ligase [Candidatus Omnitrophota bacterium]
MPVVRFAPSPTGFLHIGGARTCLFNWLYARSTKGKFILRIEDTDQVRSEPKYLEEILESLKWMGLDWDEIYYQSKRFDIYMEHAQKLLDEGKAFKEGEAIIYKIPQDTKIRFFDVLRGEIAVDTEQLKDQVMIKSDGSPAYNFCCVVDDALMGMTHIIRGDDHIANTPKQIMLYEALGFKPPKFVHIPMIHGEDGSRMSKRHGATAISEYRKQGYLPEALINYLALLGWNPGTNKEIFSKDDLINEFSLRRINKTAAIFDINRLSWVNGQYIKEMDIEKLTQLIVPFLKEKEYIDDNYDKDWLKGLIDLYKTRLPTLSHFAKLAGFFFIDNVFYDEAAVKEFLMTHAAAEYIEKFKQVLEMTEPFEHKVIEENIRNLVADMGIKAGDIIHPARVALTGGTVSPGIFEIIEFLGKQKTIARLDKVITKINTRAAMFDKLKEL